MSNTSLSPGELEAVIKRAIPLDDAPQYGGGVVWHPASMSLYVVGRHRLTVQPVFVRIPMSVWVQVAAHVLLSSAVPSLRAAEANIATQPPTPAA